MTDSAQALQGPLAPVDATGPTRRHRRRRSGRPRTGRVPDCARARCDRALEPSDKARTRTCHRAPLAGARRGGTPRRPAPPGDGDRDHRERRALDRPRGSGLPHRGRLGDPGARRRGRRDSVAAALSGCGCRFTASATAAKAASSGAMRDGHRVGLAFRAAGLHADRRLRAAVDGGDLLPVIQADAGDARNSTAAATSSTSPRRPRACARPSRRGARASGGRQRVGEDAAGLDGMMRTWGRSPAPGCASSG